MSLSDLWPVQPPLQHVNVHARVQARRDGVWAMPLTSSVPNPFQECAPCPPSYNIGHSLSLPVHFASVSEARAAPPPSTVAKNVVMYKEEQGNHPIYDGPSVDLHGPPVEIYDEALAKLKDDLRYPSKVLEPSTDYIVQIAELFHAFATIYDSEPPPKEAFLGPLRRLLGTDLDFVVKVPEGNFDGVRGRDYPWNSTG